MPSLLDPDRWQELEPELRAGEHLRKARELLVPVNAVPTRDIDRALQRLHPATRDPKALEEFEARLRGDFQAPAPIVQGYTQEQLDAAVDRALERERAKQQQQQQPQRQD